MDAKTIIGMQSPAYEPDGGGYWPSTTPGAVIGITRSGWPIRLAAGGADDDDAGDGEGNSGEEDADTEEEQDGDGEDEKKTEETEKPKPKEDLVSRSELRKAVAERQKAKAELRAREKELADLKAANEGAEATAARKAREAAEQAAEAKYKPVALRAALLEAGVLVKKVPGALKLLDMGEIDIDDNGDVTGLDMQLDGLREDWPELFPSAESEAKTERRGSRAADGADKKPEKKKPPTTTERQAAALLGKPIR
ncbi:phage scaffolding protein [Actinomadura scrupuli]|uniref:phage scaffolding protein n=1 Tax=Actinomadura scrupuli TaxID=559629 RepID=UPI003D97E984